ncbi:Peptidoglycan/xylan/chitin deacetylase, PgdA/CDA1 family [Fictibacillus enclensis]|uniref:Polysaccharide deacetylase n=1 Tax=Fictibacillus enclensis TaxID=1017270 RepID=A0A0V8JAT1_9BACL|nr:polysaccharide deacetylase family protein [Fictibacillus enclensis]KSU84036.1 polysaccharide deacetylase [Fictibacillus enclensis]SCB72148.1 Peptidoglycan/xylan/chitin deacetylase, PgdA/CDA1 family [Fictibacillus enclensis]
MIILYCVCTVVLLFLLYGIIPTIFIRLFAVRIIKNGPTERKEFFLTFDDGPHPVYTPQLLDLLKSYNVPAAFFIVGERAEREPELLKRMSNEGHTVGIHHQTHSNSWLLTPGKLKKEISRCATVIQQATGKKADFYRPPWGRFNLFSLLLAREYQIIMWSSITGDWKAGQGKDKLAAKLKKSLHSGCIYLLHDNGENPGADDEAPSVMLEALRGFLEYAQRQGYIGMPLEELKNTNKRG